MSCCRLGEKGRGADRACLGRGEGVGVGPLTQLRGGGTTDPTWPGPVCLAPTTGDAGRSRQVGGSLETRPGYLQAGRVTGWMGRGRGQVESGVWKWDGQVELGPGLGSRGSDSVGPRPREMPCFSPCILRDETPFSWAEVCGERTTALLPPRTVTCMQSGPAVHPTPRCCSLPTQSPIPSTGPCTLPVGVPGQSPW